MKTNKILVLIMVGLWLVAAVFLFWSWHGLSVEGALYSLLAPFLMPAVEVFERCYPEYAGLIASGEGWHFSLPVAALFFVLARAAWRNKKLAWAITFCVVWVANLCFSYFDLAAHEGAAAAIAAAHGS